MVSRIALSSAVVALASVIATAALAQSSEVSPFAPQGLATPSEPTVGQSVMTPGGPAVVTGHVGSMATTALPGGGQGLLMNNGNGTSTLIMPNGTSEGVGGPR